MAAKQQRGRKRETARYCKKHPAEHLTVVEHSVSRRGKLIHKETLYICEKCPAFLSDAQTEIGKAYQQMELL